MKEYHKIQTVYLRDPESNYKTLLEGQFATPQFEWLQNNRWIGTEKIDGTNIRIGWDGERVSIGGRTDRAQIPAGLLERLQELFTNEKLSACFSGGGFFLYGEGFGAKIQKGGPQYISDGSDFILFDISYNDFWMARANVADIANSLGLRVVPVIFSGQLSEAVEVTRGGITSQVGECQAEGLVLRPECELLDQRGRRVIAKIKCKDFILAEGPTKRTEIWQK